MRTTLVYFALILMLPLVGCSQNKKIKENKVEMSDSEENLDTTDIKNMDTATFGAGCFWCVEAVFQMMKGVEKVESGYAGGHLKNPSYKEVCSGNTGHAEVARIWFDSSIISYETLLDIFWHAHNPTTLNRQGNDVGTQYRSVIFYHNEKQKEIAEKSKIATDSSGLWPDSIVTEILSVPDYYSAEDYHQNYLENNPGNPYCSAVVAPKVQKIRQKYKALLKE
ncbi:MAG: peptide-methionine (S)-S-oxide reductase MsrA [Flavobacteriales bacterium]|nr:peptide-methionine (S)-S-oxide reductase MsrA [Flavobacteriales bacterium]